MQPKQQFKKTQWSWTAAADCCLKYDNMGLQSTLLPTVKMKCLPPLDSNLSFCVSQKGSYPVRGWRRNTARLLWLPTTEDCISLTSLTADNPQITRVIFHHQLPGLSRACFLHSDMWGGGEKSERQWRGRLKVLFMEWVSCMFDTSDVKHFFLKTKKPEEQDHDNKAVPKLSGLLFKRQHSFCQFYWETDQIWPVWCMILACSFKRKYLSWNNCTLLISTCIALL